MQLEFDTEVNFVFNLYSVLDALTGLTDRLFIRKTLLSKIIFIQIRFNPIRHKSSTSIRAEVFYKCSVNLPEPH